MMPALTFKTDDSHDWVKDHITLLERRRFVSRLLETNSVIMPIHGFQTLTLLDYPGYTAATVFLGGCNFRCPFCQNAGLVLHPEKEPVIAEEDVLAFLKKKTACTGWRLYHRWRTHTGSGSPVTDPFHQRTGLSCQTGYQWYASCRCPQTCGRKADRLRRHGYQKFPGAL